VLVLYDQNRGRHGEIVGGHTRVGASFYTQLTFT
jgi:hypothetical protein